MIGKRIYNFEIKRHIDSGGMADVYYAENNLGKPVAIKVLKKKFSEEPTVHDRFLQEARIMVTLDHPYICKVHDIGEVGSTPVIIMEYLRGETLRDKIESSKKISHTQLVKYYEQCTNALSYTHAKAIIHRDIKPSNIFITSEDNVKILDFGIAKTTDGIKHTLTGQTLGTVLYMSPEQVRDPKRVNYKTDLYSLGVTFYHALTNKAPYDVSTDSEFTIQTKIVNEDLEMNKLPISWRKNLKANLQKKVERRQIIPFSQKKSNFDSTQIDTFESSKNSTIAPLSDNLTEYTHVDSSRTSKVLDTKSKKNRFDKQLLLWAFINLILIFGLKKELPSILGNSIWLGLLFLIIPFYCYFNWKFLKSYQKKRNYSFRQVTLKGMESLFYIFVGLPIILPIFFYIRFSLINYVHTVLPKKIPSTEQITNKKSDISSNIPSNPFEPADGDFSNKKLACGIEINIPKNWTEDQFIRKINSTGIRSPFGDDSSIGWIVFDRLTFATGRANLDINKSEEQLTNVAEIMKCYPNTKIKIGGFTDSIGNAKANKILSQNRADAVRKVLVDKGISADRIKAIGYGIEHPIASNDTPEGRAKNRRIALKIIAK